jgi:hypothetical protein
MITTHPCPSCAEKLDMWMDGTTRDLHCYCPNVQCVLFQYNIISTGQHTAEALADFQRKAVRLDANFALRK